MSIVKVSPKYQVVIPLDVRQALHVNPGERFEVIPLNGRIEFVPVKALKKMRGFAKGVGSVVNREDDRI